MSIANGKLKMEGSSDFKASDKKITVKVRDIYSPEEFIEDCPKIDEIPTFLPAQDRVIVIGDIHGDYDLAVQSFKLAKLINDNFEWVAKPLNTVVVQVGDQIDSCRPIPGIYDCQNTRQKDDKSEDMKVIQFFDDMAKKAKAKGGAVYSLLGNHELMNVQMNFNYVSYDNYYDFEYVHKNHKYTGRDGRAKAFQQGGPIARNFACNRLSVLVVGSCIFVHAGVLPALVKKLDTLPIEDRDKIKYLNAVVRKWLLKKVVPNQHKNLLLSNSMSPFWTRIYGNIPTNTSFDSGDCDAHVKKILEVLKIGHIIVGHTPQLFTNKEGINGTCYEQDTKTKKLYRVDGGFSKAFKIFEKHEMVQVLEIIKDTEFNILKTSKLQIYEQDETNLVDSLIPGISSEEIKNVSKIYAQNRIKVDKNK
jgi:hypothetical protein